MQSGPARQYPAGTRIGAGTPYNPPFVRHEKVVFQSRLGGVLRSTVPESPDLGIVPNLAVSLRSRTVLPATLLGGLGPRLPLIIVAALITVAAWQSAEAAGIRQAALALTGVGLGLALARSGFGFAGAWRAAVVENRGAGLRAQLALLAVLTVVFFPLLARGEAFGQPLADVVRPVGVSLLIGAFLFGIGAQLASGCSSGSFCGLGNGKLRYLVVAISMVAGAFLASAHWGWWESQPRWFAFSMLRTWGPGPALAVNLFLIGALAAVSVWIERKRYGRLDRRPPTDYHLLRGPWPMSVGVLALAALCVATLLLAGRPWIIISALPLWGAKVSASAGLPWDVEFWDYWSGDARLDALGAGVWSDITTVMIVGLVLGTALASALSGTLRLHLKIGAAEGLAALAGGFLLGYGGVIGLGCNIGAFLAGVSSGSLHGWVWLAAAFAGTAVGVGINTLAAMAGRQFRGGPASAPA